MHAVTCRSEGCANNGFTLILTQPGHTIICGPCGEAIEDVEPVVTPGPEPVVPDTVSGPDDIPAPDTESLTE